MQLTSSHAQVACGLKAVSACSSLEMMIELVALRDAVQIITKCDGALCFVIKIRH